MVAAFFNSGSWTDCITSVMLASWTASNAIPDSIIMNMTCLRLVPPVPKVRSNEVVTVLISKNTLRILNTIKPVTMVFTAMDRTKLVGINGFSGIPAAKPKYTDSPWKNVNPFGPSDAREIARGDKLKSAYQT
jgi:hypothetical protein